MFFLKKESEEIENSIGLLRKEDKKIKINKKEGNGVCKH